MRTVLALAAALALAAPARMAEAQGDKAQVDERARFKAAQQLYDKGDFAGALEAFRAISSPNARMYVGRCLRELKRLPEAYEELTLTIREATARAQTEPRYADTRDAASAERAAIVPKLGRFSLVGTLWMLYLVYLGAPFLMKVPTDRAERITGFGLVAVAAAAFIALLMEGIRQMTMS